MKFTDVIEHWAKDFIEAAGELGIINGYPDGTFGPEKPITRAEAAVIAMRLYERTEDSFENVLSKVDPAIVQIESTGLGSGTSIGNGFILTNAHVVGNNNKVGIRWDGWEYEPGAKYAMGPVVFKVPELDLAIVRADIGPMRDVMPKLPLGSTKNMRRGMPVLVAGSPQGYKGSVTSGVVSYIGRYMRYQLSDGATVTIPDAIQTDAAINPGNSGGALVNLKGELIGVPSVKLVDLAVEGMGFCIGLETVREVINRADKSGVLAMAYTTELMSVLRGGMIA